MSNTVSVREALLADLDAVDALHREGFAGSMGEALGQAYRRELLNLYLRAPNVFLVAEVGGQVVGYVFGGPHVRQRGTNLRLGPAALLGMLRRPDLLLRVEFRAELGRRLRAMVGREVSPEVPQLPGPSYALVAVGTAASHRRRGIGRALVQAFAVHAFDAGARSAFLAVHPDNVAAQRTYLTAGWRDVKGEAGRLFYVLENDAPSVGGQVVDELLSPSTLSILSGF